MTGPGENLEHEALFASLTEDVKELTEGNVLTIVHFTMDGIVTWDVRRDEAGTPRGRYWPLVPWPDVCEAGVLSKRELSRIAWPQDGSRPVFVCGAPEYPYVRQAFELVINAHSGAPAFRFTGALDELLRRVIEADLLTQWYELVTLRRTPSGQLVLTGTQLFPPGARRGERQPFTVRCEPSGENGTVFAVVATESVDQVQLVSLNSVSVPPGTYNLTAVLRRPGLVRFEGLPAKLHEDPRSWPEIVASVPERLDLPQPAHLICAVEVSGTSKQVDERIELTGQFIQHVAAGSEGRLKVSLISYGPHAVGRSFSGEPARVLTWAQDRATALAELGRMKDRGARPTGYPRAAQLECVFAKVAEELEGHDQDYGRPVMVTAGSRPAFPQRLDPVTEIIPCPERNDWRTILRYLKESHPGIAFGAISDRSPKQDIWPHLASGAFAPTNINIFNVQSFAERLGLLSKVEYIPFPLIEPEGS